MQSSTVPNTTSNNSVSSSSSLTRTEINTERMQPVQITAKSTLLETSEKKLLQETRQLTEIENNYTHSHIMFSAFILHELRNILNNFVGTFELLSHACDELDTLLSQPAIAFADAKTFLFRTTTDLKETRFNIKECIDSGRYLINNALPLAQLQSSNLKLNNIVFSPKNIIERLTSTFSHQIADKKLDVSVSYDTDLPLHVIADPEQIKLIVTNLLSNAIKFTPKEGHISIHIKNITLNSDSKEEKLINYLQIKVIDSGIGMSEQEIARIFAPFQQAHSSIKEQFGGTGLGLFLIKSLLQLMKGKVTVESKKNEGTTFSILIPWQQPSAEQILSYTSPTLLTRKPKSIFVDLTGKNILIVDDNSVNRNILIRYLKYTKCTCTTAVNGEEALNIVKNTNTPFDLILMDLDMPKKGGAETIRDIRALADLKKRNVAIVCISGTTKENATIAKELGIKEFLPKPFGMNPLMTIISKILSPDSLTSDSNTQPLTKKPVSCYSTASSSPTNHSHSPKSSCISDAINTSDPSGHFKPFHTSRESTHSDIPSFVQSLPAAFISINSEGVITEFNATAGKMFGLNPEKVINKEKVDIIVPKKYQKMHEVKLSEFKHTGRSPSQGHIRLLEAIRYHPDGSTSIFPIALSIFGIVSNEKMIGAHAVITEDFSSQLAQLKSHQNTLAQFQAVIANLLLNPVNALLNAIDLISECNNNLEKLILYPVKDKPEFKESQEMIALREDAIQTIKQAGNTQKLIISNVMQFANLGLDQAKLKLSTFNPIDEIKNLVEQFQGTTKNENIAFIFTSDTGIHPKLKIITDITVLKFIVSELIRTAMMLTQMASNKVIKVELKHSTLKSNSSRSDVKPTENAEKTLQCSVTNYGPKIPYSSLSTIFEFNIHNPPEVQQFPIYKASASLINGNIFVESKDIGSTFTLEFMCNISPKFSSDEKSIKTPNRTTTKDLIKFLSNALIVDDEKINHKILIRHLHSIVNTIKVKENKTTGETQNKSETLAIAVVENGQQAIDNVKQHKKPFSIIFIDIVMPVKGGLDATREIRALGYQGVIIGVSANATQQDIENGIKAGMNGYIAKPFTAQSILQTLENLIQQELLQPVQPPFPQINLSSTLAITPDAKSTSSALSSSSANVSPIDQPSPTVTTSTTQPSNTGDTVNTSYMTMPSINSGAAAKTCHHSSDVMTLAPEMKRTSTIQTDSERTRLIPHQQARQIGYWYGFWQTIIGCCEFMRDANCCATSTNRVG